MSVTDIPVSGVSDWGYLAWGGMEWPPVDPTWFWAGGENAILILRNFVPLLSGYDMGIGFLRFNLNGAIPAGDVISAAHLNFYAPGAQAGANSPIYTVEHYYPASWPPGQNDGQVDQIPGTAYSAPFAEWQAQGWWDLPLGNIASLNRDGYTGFRIGIYCTGAPTGGNYDHIYPFDPDPPNDERYPFLRITHAPKRPLPTFYRP